MKKFLLWLVFFIAPGALAQDAPWQQFPLVGQAELNFFFWPVYEARLYSDSGSGAFEYPATRPFALALEYKREFSKEQLIAETQKQWQAIGVEQTDTWLQALENVLCDVNKNDVLTLYVDSNAASIFYFNDTLVGRIEDPEFTEKFAAIWLSDKTTRPDFRNFLLGSSL